MVTEVETILVYKNLIFCLLQFIFRQAGAQLGELDRCNLAWVDRELCSLLSSETL